MGFLDKIKSGIKKIDKKLGGFLPGGPTPSEVRAEKQAPQEQPKQRTSTKPVDSPFKQPGTPSTKEEFGQSLRDIQGVSERTIITPEELAGGLVQEDIDNGLSLASVGTVNAITPDDVFTAVSTAIGGAALVKGIKAGVGFIGKNLASAAARSATQTVAVGQSTVAQIYVTNYVPTVAQTASRVVMNPKTVETAGNVLTKTFSKKALALMGGVGAWVGAVGFGKWGQAEGPEAVQFQMNKAIQIGEDTGNWDIYEEAKEARDELLDVTKWEQIALWSPLSPLKGVPTKIKGGIAAALVSDKIAADKRTQQETGGSDADRWAAAKAEESEQERANIDYYNEQRKLQITWEAEAESQGRKKEAKFWREERAAQAAQELEDLQAIQEFWAQYRLMQQQAEEDKRPSNLSFGGLF